MIADFPDVGTVFLGRYELEDVIGFGGYGRVYRATQLDLGRHVAIKILKPPQENGDTGEPVTSESFRRRFDREAKTISQLRDSHTVVMHDYGTTEDGLLYMVLEHVAGRAVSEVVLGEGGMAPERVVHVLRQVLSSLREAHSLGILHRDIKPGNIMMYDHVADADCAKLLDFGLAKIVGDENKIDSVDLTADDILVGTPRYMSPEQVHARPLTAASDLYSLGLVAIEMLSGEKVIKDQTAMSIVARHISREPFDLSGLDVPSSFRSILARMVEKDVALRFQSAGDVIEALENWEGVSRRTTIGLATAAGVAVATVLLVLAVVVTGPSGDGSSTASPVAPATASADHDTPSSTVTSRVDEAPVVASPLVDVAPARDAIAAATETARRAGEEKAESERRRSSKKGRRSGKRSQRQKRDLVILE